MSRIYKAAPHSGSTPKAGTFAAAASANAAGAAATAPVSSAAASAPSPSTSASVSVTKGDGGIQCDGCGKRLFGSGQQLGSGRYCTNCFKTQGGRRGDWKPSSNSAPVFTGVTPWKPSTAAAPAAAAAAKPAPKPAAAAVAAAPAASPKQSGVTECHFCDQPIAGKRAPSHDVGGEPYCDVCYREMSNSLADANEKAAEVAYKLGGGGGGAQQTLHDTPTHGAGGFNASGYAVKDTANITDGDLKTMFMANYRKGKTGGGAAGGSGSFPAVTKAAPAAPAGQFCGQCGTANDADSKFCSQCGAQLG